MLYLYEGNYCSMCYLSMIFYHIIFLFIYSFACLFVRCYHGHVTSVKVLSDYQKARGVKKSENVSMVRRNNRVIICESIILRYS